MYRTFTIDAEFVIAVCGLALRACCGATALLSSFRDTDKIAQELQPDFLALLRMKLGGEDIVAPNSRSKRLAVSRPRRNNGLVHRFWKEAVDKIDIAVVGDAFKQRTVSPDNFQLVPANLRDFQTVSDGESHDTSLKDT